MKENISIPLSIIGSNIDITFGKSNKTITNVFNIDSIYTKWTESFLNDYELENEQNEAYKITGTLKICKEQFIYRVNGKINFHPKLECVRCLSQFRKSLEADLNGFFISKSHTTKEGNASKSKLSKFSKKEDEIELTENDLDCYYYQGNTIILDELLLDSLFYSIPELPLCKEECKGLCTECGTDLNGIHQQEGQNKILHKKHCTYFQKNNE